MNFIRVSYLFPFLLIAGGCKTVPQPTNKILEPIVMGKIALSDTNDPDIRKFHGRDAWVKPSPVAKEHRADACYKSLRGTEICPSPTSEHIDIHAPENLCRSKGYDGVLIGSKVPWDYVTGTSEKYWLWRTVQNKNNSYDWSINKHPNKVIIEVTCVKRKNSTTK